MKPVFSVITITYNAVQWIEGTIRSVVGQTYGNIEYIIIDGKSTDGTVDIIKKYESDITYWISEPDNGLYDAMNKGIKQATGDYLWFINAGDSIYDKNTTQSITNMLTEQGSLPDIIYGQTAIIDEKGIFLGLHRFRTPEKLTWKSFKMGMKVSHQSFIAKRQIAPLFDLNYRFSADFDWCIKCMKQAKVIFNTHMPISNYRNEGISTKNRKPSVKERYRIMCNYYGKIPTILRHFWFAIRFCKTQLTKKKV